MNIPSWCRRGQKVVCLVGTWNLIECDARGPPVSLPKIGVVYTISAVSVEADGWCGIELVELEAGDWFGRRGFAPVVEDDTEARLFRAHPSSGASRHLLPQGEKGRRRVPA